MQVGLGERCLFWSPSRGISPRNLGLSGVIWVVWKPCRSFLPGLLPILLRLVSLKLLTQMCWSRTLQVGGRAAPGGGPRFQISRGDLAVAGFGCWYFADLPVTDFMQTPMASGYPWIGRLCSDGSKGAAVVCLPIGRSCRVWLSRQVGMDILCGMTPFLLVKSRGSVLVPLLSCGELWSRREPCSSAGWFPTRGQANWVIMLHSRCDISPRLSSPSDLYLRSLFCQPDCHTGKQNHFPASSNLSVLSCRFGTLSRYKLGGPWEGSHSRLAILSNVPGEWIGSWLLRYSFLWSNGNQCVASGGRGEV